MNGWFNPDSWMDVIDHFLLVVGVLITTMVPAWFAARNHKVIKDVKDQVVNGHKSPLRSDLDRVLARLDELSQFVVDISKGLAGLRSELGDEESRRRESVRELRGDADRNFAEIERKLSELENKIDGNK